MWVICCFWIFGVMQGGVIWLLVFYYDNDSEFNVTLVLAIQQ